MSDVDVSVSIDTQLNVRSITRRNTVSSSVGAIAASVKNSVIRVAMSGSIIPTPLATPTIRAGPGPTVADATLGWVSVVMIPAATGSASLPAKGQVSASSPDRTRSIGYCRPITPVEAISTSSSSHPNTAATPATTSRAFASPTGPVATLAFFEMTTTARAAPSATFARLTTTLGPENRDRVNTPAAGQARSAATITKSSVSSLMPTLVTWQLKPRGSGVVTTPVVPGRRRGRPIPPGWRRTHRRAA